MANPIFVPFGIGTHWEGRIFINCAANFGEGWSEKYHLRGASVVEALSNLDSIWLARQATLAGDCSFVYGYVSDMKLRGDSSVYFPGAGHFIGSYGDIHVFTFPPWNTLLLRLESNPLYRTIRPLRGIPTDQTLHSGFTVAPYLAAVDAFITVLKANAFNFNRINPLDPNVLTNFHTISNGFQLRFSERRAGRPFGLLHGRSRRQRAF